MSQNTTAFDSHIPEIEYFIERKCQPGWCITEDVVTFHDLSYIFAGRAIYTIDGVEYPLSAGDLLYVPPGSARSAITDPENLMSMYSVNFNWLYPQNDTTPLPFQTVTAIGFSHQIIGLYKQMNQQWLEKKYGYRMESRGLFCIVLSRYLTAITGENQPLLQDNRIVKVKSYILNNFDRPISLKILAEYIGLSPNYLGTLFCEVEGISVKAYINKIRINNAENLLLNEQMTVSEVAEKCGFSDLFYFSKVYKQLKGIPPTHTTRYALYR